MCERFDRLIMPMAVCVLALMLWGAKYHEDSAIGDVVGYTTATATAAEPVPTYTPVAMVEPVPVYTPPAVPVRTPMTALQRFKWDTMPAPTSCPREGCPGGNCSVASHRGAVAGYVAVAGNGVHRGRVFGQRRVRGFFRRVFRRATFRGRR